MELSALDERFRAISGGGRGGGAHSLDEWYEDGPDGYKGPQAALLLVAALAGTP